MIKKDYLKKIKELEETIRIAQSEISLWKKAFKQDCKHEAKDLNYKINSYQDEYGRWVERTDYDYFCTRCDTRIRKSDKRLNTKELRALLKEEASKIF